MKLPDTVSASVEVALDPMTAFVVFTEEINRWWRPGPINWNDSARAVGICIEPGIGGRWIEVYDEATGEGFECGRITVWEPGIRFVFLYRDAGHTIDDTEVEVRFEAIDGGTRVTLEHRRWDKEYRYTETRDQTMGMGQYPRLVQGMGFLGDAAPCAKKFRS